MKREILEALKTKFQGVSESILNRIADKMAKTVTTAEQVQTTVDAYTWQQLIEGYGDSRATEATQTAVRSYEAKYGLKEGIKIKIDGGSDDNSDINVTKKETGVQTESVPAWAKSLIETNKALSERLNKIDGERTTESRRQQLSSVINKLPEKLRAGYNRTSVKDLSDEEFSTLLGEISSEVESIVKETTQKGAVFGRPSSSQGGTGTQSELTKEQIESISKRETKPVDGQPF